MAGRRHDQVIVSPVASQSADTLSERGGPYDGLPALIVEMAEVAGLAAAMEIARARGGNRLYIPARAGDDHWLVATVGREAADKLCAHFATPSGIELEMPRGPSGLRAETWRRMYQMIADGRSSTEITRALGISRDMVKYHRAKIRSGTVSAQLSLFPLLTDD